LSFNVIVSHSFVNLQLQRTRLFAERANFCRVYSDSSVSFICLGKSAAEIVHVFQYLSILYNRMVIVEGKKVGHRVRVNKPAVLIK
jgi:hypothetical protein